MMARFVVAALLLAAIPLSAAEPVREQVAPPKVQAEILPPPFGDGKALPPPQPVVAMGPLGPVLPGFFQPDLRAQRQLYAIDRQGFLKPRVMMAPQPFYLYNGQPYYFLQTNPLAMAQNNFAP
jgi:hypothetical protein